MKKYIMAILSLLMLLTLASCNEISISNQDISTNVKLISDQSLETDELYGAKAAENETDYTLESMLQYALEDEKLALAEYKSIINTFDVTRPFTNIIVSEETHISLILELYDTYNMEIKDFDASEHLIIPTTLEETYEIGVQAEIDNIAMYNIFLEQELNDDVREVFISLRDGSLSHLSAFEKNVTSN